MTSLPRIDPLLDEPVFTRWDVTSIAEISDGQLKGILDRKQIVLGTEHNPGSGRRRMFTGADHVRRAASELPHPGGRLGVHAVMAAWPYSTEAGSGCDG